MQNYTLAPSKQQGWTDVITTKGTRAGSIQQNEYSNWRSTSIFGNCAHGKDREAAIQYVLRAHEYGQTHEPRFRYRARSEWE